MNLLKATIVFFLVFKTCFTQNFIVEGFVFGENKTNLLALPHKSSLIQHWALLVILKVNINLG